MNSVALLALLGRLLRLPIRETDLERVWRRTSPTNTPVTPENWADRLETAGRAIGLQMSPIRLTAAEAAREAVPSFPLVTWAAGTRGSRWVVVLEKRVGSVRVALPGETTEEVWLGLEELEALIGPPEPGAVVAWRMASESVPMEPASAASLADHSHNAAHAADPIHGDHGHGHNDHGHHEPMPLRRIWKLFTPESGDIWRIVLFALGVALLSLATPITVEALVNTVAFGVLLQPVIILAAVLLCCLLLAAALRVFQITTVEAIQQRLFVRVAGDMAHRLPRMRLEVYERDFGPELVNRFFDVPALQKSTAALLLDGIAIIVSTAVGMAVLALYHPFLIGVDIALLVGLSILIFVLGRGGIRTGINESARKYELAGWLEEAARLPRAFKTGHGEVYAAARANEVTHEWIDARRAHFRVVMRQTVFALFLQVAVSTVLLGLGGYLVLREGLTLGQLVAAELIVSLIVSSFAKLGKYFEAWYDLCVAVEKIGHVIDQPLEAQGGQPLPFDSRGLAARMRDVHGDRGDHWDFEAAAGERLAILMPDGVEPIGDWLAGWRSPHAGAVTLDGLDVRDLNPAEVRAQVAVVGGAVAIAGTLEDNLRLGCVDATEGDLLDALRAVGLGERFADRAARLRTRIIPDSHNLRPDEAVLLQVARAVLARPRLLVIEGALDRLAPRVAERLRSLLTDPERPWTLILITARPELSEWGTRIITVGHDPDAAGHGHHHGHADAHH